MEVADVIGGEESQICRWSVFEKIKRIDQWQGFLKLFEYKWATVYVDKNGNEIPDSEYEKVVWSNARTLWDKKMITEEYQYTRVNRVVLLMEDTRSTQISLFDVVWNRIMFPYYNCLPELE